MTVQKQPAQEKAREARDHPALSWAARVGVLAYGVVYLLVAWLAAQLALGSPAGTPSGQGALEEVAQKPLGSVALWLAAAGLAALAFWETCQAIGGHRSDEGVRRWAARAGSAGRAAVFTVLAVLAIRTTASSSGGDSDGLTAQVMRLPIGPVLVAAVGVGIAGVGVFSLVRAVTDRWRKDLEVSGQTGEIGRAVAVLARVGYGTRGLAFLVIAGMFGWAAVTHDAEKSGGLDQAIVRFRDEPFGPWLIVLVAVGLACYGAFHVVRAWYLRGS